MTGARPTRIAIAVVHHDDKFLIGRRSPAQQLAGYWEFPGGKLHDGETPQQAALRECREETGLEVSIKKLLIIVEQEYDYGPLELHFFLCEPPGPPAEPTAPFRWVAREELACYKFPAGNDAVIARLAAGAS